ncbi:MAG: flagellar FliJ family protein [Clostridia bacterium]|nr:flagellar FliJ family protein [Clostridia bacterium]
MKKFEFQMEKLLKYKNQVLGSQMMVLADLNAQLAEEQSEKKALEDHMDLERKEFEKKTKGATLPHVWQIHAAFVEHTKEKIALKEQEILYIQKSIDEQREVIKNTKIETRSLEIIREARYDEYRKEEEKKAEQEIEEFVSAADALKKISDAN